MVLLLFLIRRLNIIVVKRRKEMLKNFHVELNGKKFFQVQKILEPKSLPDVLVTFHQKPEDPQGNLIIFHFIANAYSPRTKGKCSTSQGLIKMDFIIIYLEETRLI
ncbi:hypothetical protein KHA80_12550 [Anaerobacillus sp. HL2]|nr:hypothetical protein KHA80_12550 [Anaerobacillus sp. HL2]